MYLVSWVESTNYVRKDLICFITNTQKPLNLYAVHFFDISVNSFVQILKTAFSYYTMLYNVNKKTQT
nr:unnamed protein product [Callosobruchus analis]